MKRVCDRCLHALAAHERRCGACGWVDPFKDGGRDKTKSHPVKMEQPKKKKKSIPVQLRKEQHLPPKRQLPQTPVMWAVMAMVGAIAGSGVVYLSSPAEVAAKPDAARIAPAPAVVVAAPAPIALPRLVVEYREAEIEDGTVPRRPYVAVVATYAKPKIKRKRRQRRKHRRRSK
ncbi:MAG: hypothetical protein ACI9WU_000391 [Myxococcota bacterium]